MPRTCGLDRPNALCSCRVHAPHHACMRSFCMHALFPRACTALRVCRPQAHERDVDLDLLLLLLRRRMRRQAQVQRGEAKAEDGADGAYDSPHPATLRMISSLGLLCHCTRKSVHRMEEESCMTLAHVVVRLSAHAVG
eukprot:6190979-Pleurochrysis_carterae.AAC.1